MSGAAMDCLGLFRFALMLGICAVLFSNMIMRVREVTIISGMLVQGTE